MWILVLYYFMNTRNINLKWSLNWCKHGMIRLEHNSLEVIDVWLQLFMTHVPKNYGNYSLCVPTMLIVVNIFINITQNKTSLKVFVFFLTNVWRVTKKWSVLLNHNTTNREVCFSSITCRNNAVLIMVWINDYFCFAWFLKQT